jgi:hypothetical protein
LLTSATAPTLGLIVSAVSTGRSKKVCGLHGLALKGR